MWQVKVDRVPDGCAKGFELFRAFQLLGALSIIERQSGGPVILLFDELLLQHGFRFRFVLEELPVAPFSYLRPRNAPVSARVDLHFAKLSYSLAHGHER
jgi:hypothetical protein